MYLGVPFHDVEYSTAKSNVKFSDVQGVDEAKEELKEVVEFLKNPEKFTRIGGKFMVHLEQVKLILLKP